MQAQRVGTEFECISIWFFLYSLACLHLQQRGMIDKIDDVDRCLYSDSGSVVLERLNF
jgi:hypothetical protein